MIDRRKFLKNSTMAMAGAVAVPKIKKSSIPPVKHSFKLKYAPHLSLVGHIKDEIDRLDYCADWGFKAFEYNGLARKEHKWAEALRKRMDKLGMEMGVFTANPDGWDNTRLVDPSQRQAFLSEIKKAMPYVDIMGNKFVTVLAGNEVPKMTRAQMAVSVIEGLRFAADIAAKHNVTLCVELLNVLVNHPGFFLTRSDDGYEIMTAVNSPNVKMLFDIYHQQITEGNLINNIRQFADKIGTFHVGDNPGRHEPGSGEINYRNVFKAIHEIGHQGFLGMEYSSSIRQQPQGVEKAFQAIVDADNF